MFQRLILKVLLLIIFLTPRLVFADSESVDVSGVLTTRQLVGVVHFNQNRYGLTPQVKSEIDKLIISAIEKRGEHGIIRVEGFVSKNDDKHGQLNKAMKRARNVWNYMRLRHKITDGMYLTGFDYQQKISEIEGSRVEIVVYANPFSAESSSIAKAEGK